MMKGAVHNVLEAVGSTPIVKLNNVGSHVAADIYVKLEYLNPGGSMKDRVAINIVRDYERRGLLKPGGTIVEATSGNTGMGLALVAAIRGYKCIFVMPDKMSEEKIKSLQAFGARVVICPTAVDPEDPRSYYSVSRRLAEETPGAVLANQYYNPANPGAHYLSTGPGDLGTDRRRDRCFLRRHGNWWNPFRLCQVLQGEKTGDQNRRGRSGRFALLRLRQNRHDGETKAL